MYSITDLDTFIAIYETGGVLAAARKLSISPATASHRLRKLEQSLAVSLFYRDQRQSNATAEGEAFYQRVVPLREALREAEQAISGKQADISGILRVTLSPWIQKRIVLPHLKQFTDQHPALRCEFFASDRYMDMVDNSLDVAIRVGKLVDSNLLCRKLASNQYILCASPDYLEEHGEPQSVDELADHARICLPWQQDWFCRQADGEVVGIQTLPRVMVADAEGLTYATANGLGISIKSRVAIQGELQSGELREVLPGTLVNDEAGIWFVRPPNAVASRKVEAFYAFLQPLFSKVAGGS